MLLAVGPLPNNITSAPYIIYNSSTGLLSIIFQYGYSLSGAPQLFINNLLKRYLLSFRTKYYGINQNNFKDMSFIVQNYNNNSYALPGQTISYPPAYLIFTQEYDTRYSWGQIRSILILSNSIKSRSEYVPTYQNPNTNTVSPQLNNPNFQSVLSYFDVQVETGGPNWLQPIQYEAVNYKWIDLISSDSLNRIHLSIFFESINGFLIQCNIPINQSCNIKLLFRKKSK